MMVEAARQCSKDRKEWRALIHMCHMDRGGMPLHDVVGINCKRAQLLKMKAQLSSIWAKVCILMTVCAGWMV